MSEERRSAKDAVDLYLRLQPVMVPVYALVVAFVLAGLVMWGTGANPFVAYAALFRGMFGSVDNIAGALERSTPFIGASLAVALAFRAGLFNIGAEGQLLVGALAGAWVGTWSFLAGVPAVIGVPLILLAGVVGGLLWGGIPGLLKAKTGAHEVIVTIMMNSIALRITEWLVSSREPLLLLDTSSSVPRTAPIADGFRLFGFGDTVLHGGTVLALLLCALAWFTMERTTTGFEINAVGLNPHAATYAGISKNRIVILAMGASGALAGITGAAEVSGGDGFLLPGVFANIGFDSIAIALLARANPFAVIPAALLWGSLLAGAPTMQAQAGLSIDLVRIIQALVLLFVAADAIVRWLFRVPEGGDGRRAFASGWGA